VYFKTNGWASRVKVEGLCRSSFYKQQSIKSISSGEKFPLCGRLGDYSYFICSSISKNPLFAV